MKRVLLGAAIAALALFGYCFARGIFADDEALIRASIEDMRLAAEAKDVGRFMKGVSGDYRDDGNNNSFILRQMVGRVLGSLDSVKVRMEDIDVIVTGKTAYVTMNVTTEALKRGQLIHPFGSDQSPEKPRITLKKEGGDWKIVKVDGVNGSY